MRNTAFNYNAHQKVVEKYISKQELDENTIDDTALNPEVLMLSEEQKAEFKVLFKQLPEADQELLKGKYMFRLDDEELANMLGCKPSSVRMKLTRAKRNALKLKKEGEFACD